MHCYRTKAVLLLLAGALALGLVALAWAIGPGSSGAQQGTMHNCPQPGKWAISVWEGPDGTETGAALATCGSGAVDFAYYIDPETQQWLRYFVGRPEINTLLTLNDMQGLIAHGRVGVVLPSPTVVPSPTPPPTPSGTPAAISTKYFSFSAVGDYQDWLGNTRVIGIVKNNSASDAELAEIHAAFRDARGESLGSEYGPSCLRTVAAGGDSPFEIRVWDEPAGRHSYTLVPDGYVSDEPPASGLEVSVASPRTDAKGFYHVVGLVTNESEDTYESIRVCGALYDKDGELVRTGSSFVRDHTLGPDGSTTFDLFGFVDSELVASYRLWVDGQRR